MADVFICHASQDKKNRVLNDILQALRTQRHTLFVDKPSLLKDSAAAIGIPLGRRWAEHVVHEHTQAKIVLLFWSNATARKFRNVAQHENASKASLVWEAWTAHCKEKLICIKLSGNSDRIPGWINVTQAADLTNRISRDAEKQSLLNQINKRVSAVVDQPRALVGVSERLPVLAPWCEIDHSSCVQKWKRVNDDAVLRAVIKSYGDEGVWGDFEWLSGGTATRNFKVRNCVTDKMHLLRLHVGAESKKEIARRIVVAEQLATCFEPQFAEYILPLRSRGGDQTLETNLAFDDTPYGGRAEGYISFAQLFPLCTNAEHFNPAHAGQMESFARLLGSVQSEVQRMHCMAGSKCEDFTDRTAFSRDFENLKSVFEAISPAIESLKREGARRSLVSLWEANKDVVKASVDYAATHVTSPAKMTPLLHDMHPHNAFFEGIECKLIFDYHRIGLYTHTEVVAQVAHRFVREIVRNKISHTAGVAQDAFDLANKFLLAYIETSPPLDVEQAKMLMSRSITLGALRKLYNVLSKLTINHDMHNRSEDRLLSEAGKFIAFLHEAPSFATSA